MPVARDMSGIGTSLSALFIGRFRCGLVVMRGAILGVRRGCRRCTPARNLAQGPGISLEAVEVKAEFS
jgi:hypothetical protein